MVQTVLVGVLVLAAVVGLVAAGIWLRNHVQIVADKAAAAAERALTLPAGVAASIGGVSPVAASDLQKVSDELKAHVTDTVQSAVAAIKPPPQS